MTKYISAFLESKSGTTAIEYALIATIVSVGILSAVTSLGDNNKKNYDDVATSIGDVI